MPSPAKHCSGPVQLPAPPPSPRVPSGPRTPVRSQLSRGRVSIAYVAGHLNLSPPASPRGRRGSCQRDRRRFRPAVSKAGPRRKNRNPQHRRIAGSLLIDGTTHRAPEHFQLIVRIGGSKHLMQAAITNDAARSTRREEPGTRRILLRRRRMSWTIAVQSWQYQGFLAVALCSSVVHSTHKVLHTTIRHVNQPRGALTPIDEPSSLEALLWNQPTFVRHCRPDETGG